MPTNAKRFTRRFTFVNKNKSYEHVFYRKGVRQVEQMSTPRIVSLTPEQRRTIGGVSHVWKTGDRYYKLAEQYYGRPHYWWAIALYNNKPTEGHVKLGDTIVIPLPLEKYLGYL
jgi:nucleoid-associated protein YgaU